VALPRFVTDSLCRVHDSWLPVLQSALHALVAGNESYLETLGQSSFLPTQNRLFAAFSQPFSAVRYVLVGESPYPREESATGYCFIDGAVQAIWSEKGLSRQVNRATSLRNFIKMLLVADAVLQMDDTGRESMARVAEMALSDNTLYVRTLAELQSAMLNQGFLLLNASLVLRPQVPMAKDAKAWFPFLVAVLSSLAASAAHLAKPAPALILWGKMAEKLADIPSLHALPRYCAEHPYNLSFIQNARMHTLFAPMKLMQKPRV
jgi:uracil-DNA glycosylase